MTIQYSGQISINDIGDEYEVATANRSLTNLSTGIGLSAPHGIKEFYGRSAAVSVSGATLTGEGQSMTSDTAPYDHWIVTTNPSDKQAVIQMVYDPSSAPNSDHRITIQRGSTYNAMVASNTAYMVHSSNNGGNPYTISIQVLNGDYVRVVIGNSDIGSTHTGSLEWKNRSDGSVTLVSDTFSQYRYTPSGGGGGNFYGCFPAGMMVTMADLSEKAIETISEGDMVLGSGMQSAEVLDVWTMPQESRLIFNINGKLRMTKDHPIKIIGPTSSTWAAMDPEAANEIHPELNIQQLEIGQTLVGPDGYRETVETIETQVEDSQVYNLNVSGDDTYFVQGLLVHNK
jgi:hypothetical protein